MAYVGFVATLADGREVREGDCVWDLVPDVGLSRLALVRSTETEPGVYRHEPVGILDAAPGRRFYFYNETAAQGGGMGFLAAKGIGYLDGELAVEIRWDLLPGPTTMAVQGALRRLGGAVNLVQHLECNLPLEKLTARLPELATSIAEMKALAAGLPPPAAPAEEGVRSIAAPSVGGGASHREIMQSIADATDATARIKSEIAATKRRLKDLPAAEDKVQKARRWLLQSLDDAVEVLKQTDRDPRALWRSYPAAEFRLHTNTLRRAA